MMGTNLCGAFQRSKVVGCDTCEHQGEDGGCHKDSILRCYYVKTEDGYKRAVVPSLVDYKEKVRFVQGDPRQGMSAAIIKIEYFQEKVR